MDLSLNANRYTLNAVPFAFFGTPELVIPILDELKENDLTPSLIVTAPDKPKGRGLTLTPPPAKIWAEQNGVAVLQPLKLDSEFTYKLKAESYQLFIVVAYGKILSPEVIDIPKYGTFNVHYSLLPKYRGATPVESAILNGDQETGVSIQKMVFELDAGPIIAEEKTGVSADETAPELRARLNEMAKKLLVKTIPKIIGGTVICREQNHAKATFTKKISKEDGLIDLSAPAEENYRKYRAYFGWPDTYFFATRKSGQKVRVTIKEATLENGEFVVKRVLPEGKREMDYEDFLRGF